MQELVTVEQADAVIRVLAWAGPVAGLIVGLIAGAVIRRAAQGVLRGIAVGMLGPVLWALWLVYSGLVRYNPQTERAGLHSVATLAFSALIFIVVGIGLGALYGRLVFPPRPKEERGESGNDA